MNTLTKESSWLLLTTDTISLSLLKHTTSLHNSLNRELKSIGYQFATPGAFQHHESSNNIDLDGINITYGANHGHMWSYVAGYRNSSQHSGNCPCFNNNDQGTNPPSSIGDNYYCESGNPTNGPRATLYTNDPLWDGKQCEGTCCTGTKSPPWFSVQLPAPTTDAIEVSICCDEGTSDEDVPVELIEIYVQ